MKRSIGAVWLLKRMLRRGEVIQSWCVECSTAHRTTVKRRGGVIDAGTMLHKPWCSVDMRNIRHSVGEMRP